MEKKELYKIIKTAFVESKSTLIIIVLFHISAILICVGFWCCDGRIQNLLIGLGTGTMTSAIVSIVFNISSKERNRRNQLETQKEVRKIMMDDFKVLYYNVIHYINFAPIKNQNITLEDYIKSQHRWFHEYYKRMVADNTDKNETLKMVEQIKEFISDSSVLMQQCFEYNTSWKSGHYTDWQKKELSNAYLGYKNTQTYLQNNDYQSSFLEFAFFLETLKRLANEFDELKTFAFLSFSYDNDGKLTIQTESFEEHESMFKFAREFNEIRKNNYKKYYSKDTTGGNE